MKFRLSGKLEYFENIDKDGISHHCEKIEIDFEDSDVNSAIKKAKEIIKSKSEGWEGDVEFEKITVELLAVYPVWRGEVEPKTVKKTVEMDVIENKLKETYIDSVGPRSI